jgi:type I restriction enzyme R subunit
MTSERKIEQAFISKLQELKYTYRQDIRDLASLRQNFRERFEAYDGQRQDPDLIQGLNLAKG